MPLALIIIDHGGVRRIVANKNRVAIGPSTLAFDALLHRARRNKRNVLLQQIRSQRAQRRDVVNYPDPAAMGSENQLVIARLNRQIANGNGRKMVALKLRPAFSAINRNPESELRAEEKKIRLNQVFLNHVRVTANALRVLRCNERRPGLTVISGLENVRRHIAKGMSIKRGVSGAGIEVAGLHPVHPRILRQAGNVADDIGPGLAAVARELKIAIVRADPDQPLLLGRFADGINRGVHFRRRIVHRHSAGLFLLLLFRIVGGQVRRNAIPCLAVIARAEQKLRADIDCSLFVRRKCDRRIPVEPQFLIVIRPWLDVASLMRVAIYAADLAALIFGVDVVRISRILEHPEPIAIEHVFPTMISDAAGVLRVADPRTVVLQPAIHTDTDRSRPRSHDRIATPAGFRLSTICCRRCTSTTSRHRLPRIRLVSWSDRSRHRARRRARLENRPLPQSSFRRPR